MFVGTAGWGAAGTSVFTALDSTPVAAAGGGGRFKVTLAGPVRGPSSAPRVLTASKVVSPSIVPPTLK